MLYFIAYNLSGRQKSATDALRETLAEKFDVRRALRIPPHLTLFHPIEIPDAGPLVDALESLSQKISPFDVDTAGFGSFDERVWFLDVAQSRPLRELKRKIASAVWRGVKLREKTYTHPGVHFHVTLASKDVTPEKFARIGAFLEKRRPPFKTFTVDSFTLLRHYGGGWVAVRTFPFGALATIDIAAVPC
jgi:2'-5' RNA ligase